MHSLLHVLNTIDGLISKTVRIVCTISMMIIFVMFLANVFVRFVPIYNFTTTDEWTQFFLMWTIFFGAQELARTKGHFVVDALTDKLKGTTLGSVFKVLSSAIAILMFIAIFYGGILLISRSQAYTQTIPFMKMKYFYACIPISAFFMTIYSVRDLVEAIVHWKEDDGELRALD